MKASSLATLALVLRVGSASSAPAQNRSPLNELRVNQRPAEGRLSGLDYAVYAPDAPVARDPAAEARLLAPLEQAPSPVNDGWRSHFMLHMGRADRAVAILENALRDAGPEVEPATRSRLWNDLAVARFEAATASEAPGELVAAFEAVARSAELDPGLVEARFNRALLLQALGLNDAAQGLWTAVVESEGASGWGDEAREHLSALREIQSSDWASSREQARAALASPATRQESSLDLVSRFPQEMQELAMNDLLAEWAEASYHARSDAAEASLAAAEAVGEAARDVKSDVFVSDLVAHIRELEARAEGDALRATIDGHRAYARGVDLYDRADRRAAEADFRAAHELLSGASSPLALYARLQIARCLSVSSRYEEALTVLFSLARAANEERYPHLVARSLWIEGFVQFERIRPLAALEPLRRSYDIFTRIGERENAVAVGTILGQGADRLGDTAATWRHYTRAMQTVGRGLEPRRARQLFALAAQTAARKALPLTALELHAEAVRLSRAMESPLAIAESYWWRGETLYTLGQFERARSDSNEARVHALRIQGDRVRDRTLAGIQVLEGEVLAETAPREAVAALDRSLDAFSSTGLEWFLVRAYSARARAWSALGDLDRSEADVLSGIHQVETQAASIADRTERFAFERAARDLYDRMVALQMTRRGNPARAFAYSERAKHRGTGRETLATDAIVERLARDTVVVAYHIGRESVFAWTVSARGVRGLTLEVAPSELEEGIRRFRTALRGDDARERPEESSQALYRYLVAPLAPALVGARRIVITPDGPIADIPIAALQDAATGRYFVESHASSVAPSASSYVALVQRAAELPVGEPESALLVADPAFDRAIFPRLPSLPGARTSALAISALYPSARTFEGREATKGSFLDHVAAAEVVHFGGHAIVGAGDRSFARLLFAPGDGPNDDDGGVLYAHELESLTLERTRLVVLSACDTAASAPGENDGAVESLAQVFLSRRVPDVAASLWAVDDLVTSEFFVRFHRNFVDSGNAAAALRRTQLEFLKGDNASLSDARAWAPFVLMGA